MRRRRQPAPIDPRAARAVADALNDGPRQHGNTARVSPRSSASGLRRARRRRRKAARQAAGDGYIGEDEGGGRAPPPPIARQRGGDLSLTERRRAELRRTMAEYAAVSTEDRARAKEEAKYSRRRRFSDEDGGSGSSNPDDGETERVTASTAADRVQELIDQDKLPWWAATREELPAAAQQHQLPATSPQELEENMKYYHAMQTRIWFLGAALVVILVWFLFWYRHCPDQIQVCKRDAEAVWRCEVGAFAIHLMHDQHKLHGVPPIQTSTKDHLFMSAGASVVVIDMVFLSILHLLPWCVSKDGLPPPPGTTLQQVDRRRVYLLQTVGYWVFQMGLTLNIGSFWNMHIQYHAIKETHQSHLEEQGASGRGVDALEMAPATTFTVLGLLLPCVVVGVRLMRVPK